MYRDENGINDQGLFVRKNKTDATGCNKKDQPMMADLNFIQTVPEFGDQKIVDFYLKHHVVIIVWNVTSLFIRPNRFQSICVSYRAKFWVR